MASTPISCNSTPYPDSKSCCPAGYVCVDTGCMLPDDDWSPILSKRPCFELVDVLNADYVPPAAATSSPANATYGGAPQAMRPETYQLILFYPAVVFAVLMVIAVLACEMRRRRRRDLRGWESARDSHRLRMSARLGAGSRRDDDPELPSYAEHWRTGAQLRVDVESGGVQPPKYPEAVLRVEDPRAMGRAPRTPPPVYA
jgi:hypothetical protein